MTTNILLKRLKTIDFLHGLDSKALEQISRNAVWKIYPPDNVVFWEGDTESSLYYLQYGMLKVIKTSQDGREQVLRLIQAGETFNEVGVLAKRKNPATAVALEESGVWLIPRSAIEEVLLAHPQMALQIIENMADKFVDLISLAADLSLKSVKARFATLMLEQAKDGVIERRSWATQSEMAARLGTVPDVLSRIIRELTKAEIIEMDKKQIRILDKDSLSGLAGSSN